MDITYFIINNIRYLFKYNKYRLEIYKLVNDEECELSSKEKAYFASILANSNSYILKSSTLDNIISNNDSISNNDLIPELLEIIENFIPEDCRENFYRNLKTLKINEVSQEELGDTCYNAKENTININSNQDIEVKKRILIHELIHMASTNYDKEKGVIHTGFHSIDLNNIKEDYGYLGISEGLTESIAYHLTGSKSLDTGYFIEANLVKQLMCIVGEDICLKAFFTNNFNLIKDKMLELIHNNDKLDYTLNIMESIHLLKNDVDETDSLCFVQLKLLDFFNEKCRRLSVEAIADSDKEAFLKQLLDTYESSLLTPSKMGIIGDKYVDLHKVAVKYMMIGIEYNNFNKQEEVSDNKVMGYAKITILAILSGLVSVGIIILGMLF